MEQISTWRSHSKQRETEIHWPGKVKDSLYLATRVIPLQTAQRRTLTKATVSVQPLHSVTNSTKTFISTLSDVTWLINNFTNLSTSGRMCCLHQQDDGVRDVKFSQSCWWFLPCWVRRGVQCQMVTAVSKELTVCMFDLHLQDIRRWSQQVRSNTAIFLPDYI